MNESSRPRTPPSLGLRWLSALVLVPLAVYLTWLGSWPFLLLVAMAAVLMAFEWNRLVYGEEARFFFAVHAVISVVALLLMGLGEPLISVFVVVVGGLCVSVLTLFVQRPPLWALLGVVYTGLPCIGFVWIRKSARHRYAHRHLSFIRRLGDRYGCLSVWTDDRRAKACAARYRRRRRGPVFLAPVFWASVFAVGAAYLWGARPFVSIWPDRGPFGFVGADW